MDPQSDVTPPRLFGVDLANPASPAATRPNGIRRRALLRRGAIGLGWMAAGAAALIPLNRYSNQISGEYLERALRLLGYLPSDESAIATCLLTEPGLVERALIRFKKHARRTYRMTAQGKHLDLPAPDCFTEECHADVSQATVQELRRWVENGWRKPVSRYRFASLLDPEKLKAGRVDPLWLRWSVMREDAAAAWREAMHEAEKQGATLDGPYGDTLRPLGYAKKDGTSRRSFHICGRAIDLNQSLAYGIVPRYFISAETRTGRATDGSEMERTFFRLLCRAAKQNGTQGKFYRTGSVRWYDKWAGFAAPITEGWYIDLTDHLEQYQFRRIPAREGWEKINIRAEWWHYYYAADRQETFVDECELVGISEQRLLAAGYSMEEIDRRPG
jgi:hypothetical protein